MTATLPTTTAPPIADRRLLTSTFAILGIVMAVWGARMPAVQAAAHLGPGRLAVVLLAAAAGMVAGLQAGGRLAHRHGPSRLLVAPTVTFAAALALLGQCRTLPSLVITAVVFGAAHGVLDVAANSSAVNVQQAYGRPIMASFHAAYSLGALGGALLAAATAWLPHQVLFAAVGAATALTALAALPVVRSATHLDHSHDDAPTSDHRPARTSRGHTWLLGGLAAACLLAEGAAADWASVHLRSLHSSEAVAAGAYALYSCAMALGRLFGDRLTARYSPTTLVRTGAVLAAVGLGTGLAIGSAPAALAGWMGLGLGLSTAVPALITAAGRGGARTVGTVTTIGYLGLLTGPAAIGALAALTPLPTALALPAILAATVAAAARRALEPR
ncbi:MFS transporter [Streptomyces sp. NPDC001668]|uniref:MFS transporter n=1 Tax=Streptomyces sp. NPDC001668 TaxID=3364598 RepID=UPI0036C20AE2